MDPQLRRIVQIERNAFMTYQRIVREFYEATQELERMEKEVNNFSAEEIKEKREEIRKLALEQTDAFTVYRIVQIDCRRMEWEFYHPPGRRKEEL